MDQRWEQMRRTLPFVMAILLLTLVPLNAQALFGRSKEAEQVPGAPVARNMEIHTYSGVPYTGTLKADDYENENVIFRITEAPRKGTLEFSPEGVFIYTPDNNKTGKDHFCYTAIDDGDNCSAPATVKIRIQRVDAGVRYSDTGEKSCATAAVDLAEHGVLVGTRIGDNWFFEPERLVTRGEFVAMAMAAAGLRESDVTVTGFSDDESIPTWAKSSAAGALSAGVVRGVATDEGPAFCPDSSITLSEAAVILNRILKVTNVDLSNPGHAESAPAWYAQAVANLESVSVVPAAGYAGGPLDRAVTRSEAAELLSAMIQLSEART